MMSSAIRLLTLITGWMIIASAAMAQPAKISVEEAYSRSSADQLLLIDIRTPSEWRQSGAPASAHLLDMQSRRFVDELQALMALHPEKPVALICATGGRSGFATKRLAEFGFSGVMDVSEGMFGSAHGPGWLKRGLPLRTAEEPVLLDRIRQKSE